MSLASVTTAGFQRVGNFLRDTVMPRTLPAGGTAGQALVKNTANPYDASWATVSAGGGAADPIDLAVLDPVAPATNRVRLGRTFYGREMVATQGAFGLADPLQSYLGDRCVSLWTANGGLLATHTVIGGAALLATGTATAASQGIGSRYGFARKVEYLVTAAAVNAVAGFRSTPGTFILGNTAGAGGFHIAMRWAPCTGVANATSRCHAGLRAVVTPTDVNPSTILNAIGMGWDAGDANISLMSNDGAGVAAKTSLGASFPRPTVDRTNVFDLFLFAEPNNGSRVDYRVDNLTTGASTSGSITAKLPAVNTLLMACAAMSVGGTSSVVGITLMHVYAETQN